MKKQMSGSLGGFVNRFYSRHAETLRATSSASCRFCSRHPELVSGSRRCESGEIPNQVWNDKFSGEIPNQAGIFACQKSGFTLIELLVVVLIIGILASVAVPQYQKAVEKSQVTQALTLLQSVYSAQQVYFMSNGSYASSLDELDIDLPADWSGSTQWFPCNSSGKTYSNGQWSLQIHCRGSNTGTSFKIGRISGPYKGTGFIVHENSADDRLKDKEIYCGENRGSGILYSGKQGSYCKKLLGAAGGYPGAILEYKMP